MPETTTEVEGTNGHATGEEALTPKQLALMLKSNARTVRKFLRVQYGKIGQGNRWGLDADDLDDFIEAWHEWRAKVEAKASAEIEEPEVDSDGDEMEVNDE